MLGAAIQVVACKHKSSWVRGGTNLVSEFARLISAEAAYKANAEVIRRTEEQERNLLDVIG